ncbi:S24 family peptidase [Pseudomonas luteola]|uniref:S24 family peptidase n=1 Tax=Pseudomonas luteola TaxID=47886 RepID=UPI003A83E90E
MDAFNAGKPRSEKISQTQIADALGINQGSLSAYLNGYNALNARVAGIIAGLLGIKVSEFSPRLAEELAVMTSASRPIPPVQSSSSTADLVSQMLAKHGKNLSEEAKQRIADAVIETAETKLVAGEVITADIANPGLVGDEIHIAHYDVRAAMGGGQIASDYAEILRDVRVSETHLRELGVTYDDPHHLKIVTGWGQSMEPTIKHRDPLIVDASVREFTGDGIYLFSWQGLLYIKRLEIIDAEHFDMISDNPMHKDRPIRRDETYIQARVLLVWNARRV